MAPRGPVLPLVLELPAMGKPWEADTETPTGRPGKVFPGLVSLPTGGGGPLGSDGAEKGPRATPVPPVPPGLSGPPLPRDELSAGPEILPGRRDRGLPGPVLVSKGDPGPLGRFGFDDGPPGIPVPPVAPELDSPSVPIGELSADPWTPTGRLGKELPRPVSVPKGDADPLERFGVGNGPADVPLPALPPGLNGPARPGDGLSADGLPAF